MTTSRMKIFSGNSSNDAGQILATGLDAFTGEGMTVILELASGSFMHEQAFTVELCQDGARAVAKLRVVDEEGSWVRRAKVVAAWLSGSTVVEHGVVDRTDRRGRAKIARSTAGVGGLTLCMTEITHKRFTYVPAEGGQPPCRPAS